MGVRFSFNAPFPKKQWGGCFGHNPRLWYYPEFRLLCQVARAVARSQFSLTAIHQAV
ncbi:MAG: hypothetical protein PUP90_02305 [Nostoc sp. S4]|nr:hypothetical protein [Nostoc sp. S4]